MLVGQIPNMPDEDLPVDLGFVLIVVLIIGALIAVQVGKAMNQDRWARRVETMKREGRWPPEDQLS